MRRVPGGIAPAVAIVMSDGRRAFAVRGPVGTGLVTFLPWEIGSAVFLCSGQDVMFIRIIAATVDRGAVFVDRRPVVDVRHDMQLIEIRRDQFTVRVVPRALSDAASCGDPARLLPASRDRRASPGRRPLRHRPDFDNGRPHLRDRQDCRRHPDRPT